MDIKQRAIRLYNKFGLVIQLLFVIHICHALYSFQFQYYIDSKKLENEPTT